MKKLIILLTISICFLSCTIKEKPEFLRVENINVQESNSEFIVLTADAFFNNKDLEEDYRQKCEDRWHEELLSDGERPTEDDYVEWYEINGPIQLEVQEGL